MDNFPAPLFNPTFEDVVQRSNDIIGLLVSHRHTGADLTQPLFNTQLSQAIFTDAAVLGNGQDKAGSLTLQAAAGYGSVYMRSGINAADFANAGAKNGFIIGIDDSDSQKVKFYFGSSTNYIKYDGATLTVVGTVNISSINIPDSTTANSFHTDANGNSWWGSNVATGYTGANAYILNTGQASFKNPLVGGATYQYTIVNSGMFTFGDSSDGAATFDGSATPTGSTKAGSDYTLTRDVYYTDMTVSTGVTVNPAGYRIFGQGTLTLNGTGKVFRNGALGGDGSAAIDGSGGGASGAALADGYLKGSAAGGAGGNAGGGAGGNGASTTNSLGSSGASGGAGGAGGSAAGGAGTPGTATTSNVKLIANWHLATLLDIGSTGATVKFDNSAAASGGGAGGKGVGNGTGGGGGGSAGGIIAIYFRAIIIGASASITANGGNGGNGGPAGSTNGGGGGGGGGGAGGQIILVYNSLTNSGSLSAAAGTHGSGGAKNGTGVNGTNGSDGAAGTIRSFQVSL